MGGGFIAATGDVEPDDTFIIDDFQAIHTFGGKIDASFFGRSSDKKYSLVIDELLVLWSDIGGLSRHGDRVRESLRQGTRLVFFK